MEALEPRVSFADLQRMPEDGNRYELYDGELRVVPSPLLRHQIISGRLYVAFIEYCRSHGGQVFYAPLDLVLSEYNVLQPDLTYFGPDRARQLRADDYVRVMPDLAIEIVSPSTARIDRGRKRETLARYGLHEFWIVDQDAERVEISVLDGGRYGVPLIVGSGVLESPTLRGLRVDLASLFQALDA